MEALTPSALKEIEELVKSAGKKLLHYWPGRGEATAALSFGVKEKADGTFVTDADLESNQIITDGLNKLFPGDEILSEEITPSESLQHSKRLWILDPLDGTQSFINGEDDFSILLALTINDVLSYGIMCFPARNIIATALRGEGTVVNGQRVHVSSYTTPREKSLYIRNFELPHSPYFYDNWMDSGLAFLNVCNGNFEGVILKSGRLKEWDLAAPAILIQESGGIITDESKMPIQFKSGRLDYNYLIASNGRVHDQLLSMVPRT